VIIGASRSGTSFLARRLRWHPDVVPNFTAHEVHYFNRYHEYGERWYRMHFPFRADLARLSRQHGRRVICGEKTPDYLPRPEAAVELASMNPDVRLVALFREPVDRAYSWYRKVVRDGLETRSIDEVMEDAVAFADGLDDRPPLGPAFHYVAAGRYADLLRPWRGIFGRDQLRAWKAEDLYADPTRVLGEVLVHIGADASLAPDVRNDGGVWASASPAPDEFRERWGPAFADANSRLAAEEGISWP
jgi:hypothetical protein